MNRNFILSLLFLIFFPLCVSAQTYTRKTNLPHLFINTFNRASINSKTIYIYCNLIYVDENDVVTQYDSVSIRGRGNSTWNLSKKPYKIKFKEKQKFLGQGYANAKKWTLIANAGDKTLIRNALTSEMAKWMGMEFAPAAKFVDLTLNGVYQGNYQISDQVEVKKHRVNIVEQDYPLTSSSNITGGYLLEVDGFKDGNCFTSSKSVAIRINYPDEDEISTAQNNYIKNYVNSFERSLFATNYKDPLNGYRQFVDSVSMANLYLVTEITGNIDGFWSMYFYKNQNDSLLYFGPPWDYDIAYNNDYRIQPTQTKLMVDEGYGDAKTWFRQMWNDAEWFSKLINRRFQQLIDNGIEQFLYQKIDSLTQLINQSQKLNYNKWSINSRMYHEIYVHSTYDEYITDLKSFIHDHLIYLETAFANRLPQEPTPPFEPRSNYYNILNAKTNKAMDIYASNGTVYDENNLPQSGALLCAWSTSTDRPAQYWRLDKEGGYFIITNQLGLALNDPTSGTSTATTNVGTQLNLVTPDPTDERQLWIITPQGTQGYYNITNVYTQHTANLNGGGSADGTAVISYTTDSRNESSTNRLWYIRKTTLRLLEEPEPESEFAWNFVKGWNWAAHTLKQPVLLDVFDENAKQIVAQHTEAYHDPQLGFTGSLVELRPATMYKFLFDTDASYSFTGDFCDSNIPIAIKPGWNWIGFTALKPVALREAFVDACVSDNDILLGQDGFSVFNNGAWNGTLTDLQPAHGYMYYSTTTKTVRFATQDSKVKYRKVTVAEREDSVISYGSFDDLRINTHAFPNVMGIIATLNKRDSDLPNPQLHDANTLDDFSLDGYMLYAIDQQGVCRGVGEVVNNRLFITVYGNGGENISFKAVDKATEKEIPILESVVFSPDVQGSLNSPMILTLGELDQDFASEANDIKIDDTLNHPGQVVACYSISGVFVTTDIKQLPAGIFIVKYKDGSTAKIINR